MRQGSIDATERETVPIAPRLDIARQAQPYTSARAATSEPHALQPLVELGVAQAPTAPVNAQENAPVPASAQSAEPDPVLGFDSVDERFIDFLVEEAVKAWRAKNF